MALFDPVHAEVMASSCSGTSRSNWYRNFNLDATASVFPFVAVEVIDIELMTSIQSFEVSTGALASQRPLNLDPEEQIYREHRRRQKRGQQEVMTTS